MDVQRLRKLAGLEPLNEDHDIMELQRIDEEINREIDEEFLAEGDADGSHYEKRRQEDADAAKSHADNDPKNRKEKDVMYKKMNKYKAKMKEIKDSDKTPEQKARLTKALKTRYANLDYDLAKRAGY